MLECTFSPNKDSVKRKIKFETKDTTTIVSKNTNVVTNTTGDDKTMNGFDTLSEKKGNDGNLNNDGKIILEKNEIIKEMQDFVPSDEIKGIEDK